MASSIKFDGNKSLELALTNARKLLGEVKLENLSIDQILSLNEKITDSSFGYTSELAKNIPEYNTILCKIHDYNLSQENFCITPGYD